MDPKILFLLAAFLLQTVQTARLHASTQSLEAGAGDKEKAALAALKLELQIATKLEASLQTTLRELHDKSDTWQKKYDRWNKFWNVPKWSWISDDKKNLKAQMDDLKNNIIPAKQQDIHDARTNINRLKESIKNDAQDAVKVLKETIAYTQAALHKAMQEKEETAARHKAEIITEQKIMDKQVAAQREEIKKLGAQIQAAKQEQEKLGKGLEEGDHDLHKEFQRAKKELDDALGKYTSEIQGLEADILHNEGEIKEAEEGQEENQKAFAVALQELKSTKEALIESKTKAEMAKQEAQQKFDSTKQETQENVAKLSEELNKMIEALEADRAKQKQNLQELIVANTETMAARKMDHKEVVDRIQSMIEDYEQRVKKTRGTLDGLKATLSNPNQDSAVSEALRNAVQDLELEYSSLQQDVDRATEERTRAGKRLKVEEENLENHTKWYQWWYWKIWSKKITNIEEAIAGLEKLIRKYDDQIESLHSSMGRVQETLQSKKDDAHVAKLNEDLLIDETKSLEEAKTLKTQTEQKQAQNIEDLENEDKDEVQTFSTLIGKLTKNIAEGTKELTLLTCGDDCPDGQKHSLHEEWEAAKKVLQDSIDQQQATVENYSAELGLLEEKRLKTELAREKDNKDFEEARASLNAQIRALETQKTTAVENLESNRKELAKAKAEGKASINAHKELLSTKIDNWEKDLETAMETLKQQKQTNIENMERKKLEINQKEEHAEATIGNFETAIFEADKNLEEIQSTHL